MVGSKRKKDKEEDNDNGASTSVQQSDEHSKVEQGNTNATPQHASTNRPNLTSGPSSANRSSAWLSPGSWKPKASPVAQIAHESISVAQGATSESSSAQEASRKQSVSKIMRGNRKSMPILAEPTRVHATSDTPGRSDRGSLATPSEEKLKGVPPDEADKQQQPKVEEGALLSEPSMDSDAADVKSITSSVNRPQSGRWFGWWSRPDGYGSDGELVRRDSNKRQKLDVEDETETPVPATPKFQAAGNDTKDQEITSATDNADKVQSAAAHGEGMSTDPTSIGTSRSWFGLWSKAQNQQAAEDNAKTAKPTVAEISPEDIKKDMAIEGAPEPAAKEPTKSSGWAFWSADKPKVASSVVEYAQKQVGELAVADTPSQSHPEVAQFNEQRDVKEKAAKKTSKRASSLLQQKRDKPTGDQVTSEPSPASTPVDPGPSSRPSTPATAEVTTSTPEAIQRLKITQKRPNLILPSFAESFPQAPNPGYLERLTHYLAQTLHLPGAPQPTYPQHVFVSPPPKIKKAIAIGVHGYFPAQMLQRVLGQPTGTSIRFANYGMSAIKAWCQEHQPEVKDVEVESVALEGEGFVADRVTTLWKLLLNWLSHLRQADFILLACHSQGVPVTVMLVCKLIQLGCLSPTVRVGICAMAGINLGPFQEYRSRLFGGSALELFDFGDPKSRVSKTYAESLDVCLRHGVRITFVGSLDDQLVSLESSLHTPLSHPYVNRAVFIDGRLHAPNFLTHLVVFALKLRNLGISDHGLVRELSAPLAGSLVGGEGHSRLYDDAAVYCLAIDFALQSTDMAKHPMFIPPTAASSLLAADKDRAREVANARRASLAGYPSTPAVANGIRRGSFSSSTTLPGIAPIFAFQEPASAGSSANPFYLPWAVRGMFEEASVKRDPKMWAEVQELVQEFGEWRPTSKVLKEVRFRLEAVRSML